MIPFLKWHDSVPFRLVLNKEYVTNIESSNEESTKSKRPLPTHQQLSQLTQQSFETSIALNLCLKDLNVEPRGKESGQQSGQPSGQQLSLQLDQEIDQQSSEPSDQQNDDQEIDQQSSEPSDQQNDDQQEDQQHSTLNSFMAELIKLKQMLETSAALKNAATKELEVPEAAAAELPLPELTKEEDSIPTTIKDISISTKPGKKPKSKIVPLDTMLKPNKLFYCTRRSCGEMFRVKTQLNQHLFDVHRQPKTRSPYTKEQLTTLEGVFATTSQIRGKTMTDLGDRIGLTKRQVRIWFQNRRVKARKNSEKKARSQLSLEQTIQLKTIFAQTPFVSSETIARLARQYNRTENQIKSWFQNHRNKIYDKIRFGAVPSETGNQKH